MASADPYPDPSDTDGCLAVAAIDFGTACSGYAFAFNNNATTMNKNWGKTGKLLMKTPTCVLTELKDDRYTFLDFGYDAEERYVTLLANRRKDSVCLFNRFKMKLYTEFQPDHMTHMFDKRGIHQADSLVIFSMALKYMKDHLLQYINEKGKNISAKYIRWVLTVPAIWSVKAKSFMRKAAYQAGLIEREDSHYLVFALEAEAASIYCKSLRMNKFQGESFDGDVFMPPGTVYAIVDAGGGTVDITVHEVLTDGNVKEVCAATGGAWGGTSIDKAFVELLKRLWGAEFINLIQTEDPAVWWELENNFEKIKKTCNPETSHEAYYLLTINLKLAQRYQQITGRDITEGIGFGLSITDDYQLVATKSVVDELFSPTITNIVHELHELLDKPEHKNVMYMFLVGGFNCSPYLTNAIKAHFAVTSKILIPEEPELAVLRGAIMFGHNPNCISSRIMKRTYGIRVCRKFDPLKHAESKRYDVDGITKCKDIFSTLVEKGSRVDIGTEIARIHYPSSSVAKYSKTRIFMSTERDVVYTDEPGVEFTGGEIVIPISGGGRDRKIEIRVKFGRTEIEARAREKDNDESPWVNTVVTLAMD